MTGWLAPIAAALDARRAPLDWFVRDDDAGWEDGRLWRLLDVFARAGMPIDLAVIPIDATDALGARLVARIEAGARIGVHQHGWSHTNHEPEGRKCEFGPSRRPEDLAMDLWRGREHLRQLFGRRLDDIFTPPWNRCTRVAGELIVSCGIGVLSRDRTAGALDVPGLRECPVTVDWFAKQKGQRVERCAWAASLADEIRLARAPLGLMLHHAVMDDEEVRACDALVTTLARHGAVRAWLMRDAPTTIDSGRRVA